MKFALAALVFLAGCKLGQNQSNSSQYFAESYTGYDLSGIPRTCLKSTGKESCPVSTPTADAAANTFSTSCKKNGSTVYTCPCHAYLCSDNVALQNKTNAKANDSATTDTQLQPIASSGAQTGGNGQVFSGYDLSGNSRACPAPPSPLFCTQEIQAGDTFALNCVKAGAISYQCGCHDYICSENIQAAAN